MSVPLAAERTRRSPPAQSGNGNSKQSSGFVAISTAHMSSHGTEEIRTTEAACGRR
jgi:hypothetical protein